MRILFTFAVFGMLGCGAPLLTEYVCACPTGQHLEHDGCRDDGPGCDVPGWRDEGGYCVVDCVVDTDCPPGLICVDGECPILVEWSEVCP